MTPHRQATILIAVLTLAILIPWVGTEPLSARFSDVGTALKSVGQINALLGTVLFSLYALLVLNQQFLKQNFQLPRLGKITNRSKLIAFTLLSTHPILIGLQAIPASTSEFLNFFMPNGNWAFNFGILAIILLVVYMIADTFSKLDSKASSIPHVLAGILFLGTLHAFFIPSSLSENIFIQSYVLVLVGLTLGSYSYHKLFFKRFKRKTHSSEKIIEQQ